MSSPPRVLLFDPITWIHDWDYSIERSLLDEAGAVLVLPADRDRRDTELATADVVVVSSIDRLTADHISSAGRCVGILCYSAGMDAVDGEAAARAGIPVTNIRAGTADVADHAMTLFLAAWRMLPDMMSVAAGDSWDLGEHPRFRTIPRIGGKTMGILGPGAIGREVAVRARAFGMRTLGTYRRPETALPDLPHVGAAQLFSESDAVVLTAALTPETRGMVDRRLLAGARPGMVLVNVGRGGLVSEPDLADALDRGILRAAALDVRDREPPDSDGDALAHRTNVIMTPHMAGVSSAALTDLHRLAAERVLDLLRRAGRL